jgi:hypothetical protein
MIPFVKGFIIPYLGWYAFIFLTLCYFFVKEPRLYYKTLISLLIGLCVCYVVYFFFQTTVQRPSLSEGDWLSRLVMFVYSIDQPYNCFPSIHCFTSFLMMSAINSSAIKNKYNLITINGSGSLIILSTLLVKQHVVLDALSAVLLAHIVFAVNSYVERRLVIQWKKRRSLSWTMK